MTPEERVEIVSVLSSLLGFTEGVIKMHYIIVSDKKHGEEMIEESGEIQRAKALLRKMMGEE